MYIRRERNLYLALVYSLIKLGFWKTTWLQQDWFLLESSDSEMLACFWIFMGQAQINIGHFKGVSNVDWPILMAFDLAFFNYFVQHEDSFALPLPNSHPKMTYSWWQGTLGQNVFPVGPWDLKKNMWKYLDFK